MILVKPSIEFMCQTEHPLQVIESAGRTCYKSEDNITDTSAEKFVRDILTRGHLAVIEHASISYKVICDRGVSHEIVRHRLFSYCQESTRYCNYKVGATFVIPCWLDLEPGEFGRCNFHSIMTMEIEDCEDEWKQAMFLAEIFYENLITNGWSPQQARSVLPNSLKTEIVITGNLREWRHFLKLRLAEAAHPQMREVAYMIWRDIQSRVPVIFDKDPKYYDKE